MIVVSRILSLVLFAILALAPVRCLFSCTADVQQSSQAPPCHQQHHGKDSSGCIQHYELKAFEGGQHHHQIDLAIDCRPVALFETVVMSWNFTNANAYSSPPIFNGQLSTILRI